MSHSNGKIYYFWSRHFYNKYLDIMIKENFFRLVGVLLVQLLLFTVPMSAQKKSPQSNGKKVTSKTPLRVLPEDGVKANHLHWNDYQRLQKAGVMFFDSTPSLQSGGLRTNVNDLLYNEEFQTSAGFGKMTIIDANNDGNTWMYNMQEKYILYNYNLSEADEWAITPSINLVAGRLYYVGCTVNAGSLYDSEHMEAKWGKSPTVAGLSNELIPEVEIYDTTPKTYEKEVLIETTDNYFFGFHATSRANKYQLHLRKIYIKAGPLVTSPDKVSELKITPDPTGLNRAKIAFKAPTQAINGTALTNLTRISIFRGNQEIKSFANPAPGSLLEHEDIHAKNGINVYTVITYSGTEEGRKTQASARVGVDRPQSPEKFKAYDEETKIRFTWDAVSEQGETGGWVNPETVNYEIRAMNQDGEPGELVAVVTKETTHTLEMNPNQGEQNLATWYLAASNAAGTSDNAYTYLLMGEAYKVPFMESFPETNYETVVWINKNSKQSFTIIDYDHADGDGGSLAFKADNNREWSAINFGKITLKNTQKPYLVFYHKCSEEKPVRMEVIGKKPNGEEVILETIDYSTTKVPQWTMKRVSLESLKGERYVMPRFKAYGQAGVQLSLDAISVIDLPKRDLALELFTPKKIVKGEPFSVSTVVKCLGEELVSDYTVTVYIDGKEVKQLNVKAPFNTFGEIQTIVFDGLQIDGVAGETAQIKAIVTTENDGNASNDNEVKNITLLTSTLPSATALKAQNKEGKVRLSWQAPASNSVLITESFEDYSPWLTQFGKWTTVNGKEEATAGALFKRTTYPLQGTPFAFCVMNPSAISPECLRLFPEMSPRTGDQYAASIYEFINSEIVDADEWLISPLLSGEKQTISLWVLNQKSGSKPYPETYDLLFSKTDKNIASFEKLGESRVVSGVVWEEVRVEVPEGARYFALHRITGKKDTYMMGIDDITFKASAGTITGYKVYRNNQLLSTLEGEATTSFETDYVKGEETYAVTVLFDNGIESAPVYVTVPTHIEAILKEEGRADIYTIDGRLIRRNATDAEGLPAGIYIVNNRKCIVR